jgi:acylphosphatase
VTQRLTMLHVHLIAHGTVQGVGFRDFVCGIGESLELVGYARNLHDGTVEIVAEGAQEKLEQFCRRISVKMPAGIHVQKLEEMERREIRQPSFASFSVAF